MNCVDRIRSVGKLSLLMLIGLCALPSCNRPNDDTKPATLPLESANSSYPSDGETLLNNQIPSSTLSETESATDPSPMADSSINGPVRIELLPDGYKTGDGPLRVAVYDSPDTFNKIDLAKWKAVFESDGNPIVIELEPGLLVSNRLAIAIYQDSNSNEKLDKNAFGIPQESYGFSNNPKRGFGPPKFAEVAIPIPSEKVTLTIKLQ